MFKQKKLSKKSIIPILSLAFIYLCISSNLNISNDINTQNTTPTPKSADATELFYKTDFEWTIEESDFVAYLIEESFNGIEQTRIIGFNASRIYHATNPYRDVLDMSMYYYDEDTNSFINDNSRNISFSFRVLLTTYASFYIDDTDADFNTTYVPFVLPHYKTNDNYVNEYIMNSMYQNGHYAYLNMTEREYGSNINGPFIKLWNPFQEIYSNMTFNSTNGYLESAKVKLKDITIDGENYDIIQSYTRLYTMDRFMQNRKNDFIYPKGTTSELVYEVAFDNGDFTDYNFRYIAESIDMINTGFGEQYARSITYYNYTSSSNVELGIGNDDNYFKPLVYGSDFPITLIYQSDITPHDLSKIYANYYIDHLGLYDTLIETTKEMRLVNSSNDNYFIIQLTSYGIVNEFIIDSITCKLHYKLKDIVSDINWTVDIGDRLIYKWSNDTLNWKYSRFEVNSIEFGFVESFNNQFDIASVVFAKHKEWDIETSIWKNADDPWGYSNSIIGSENIIQILFPNSYSPNILFSNDTTGQMIENKFGNSFFRPNGLDIITFTEHSYSAKNSGNEFFNVRWDNQGIVINLNYSMNINSVDYRITMDRILDPTTLPGEHLSGDFQINIIGDLLIRVVALPESTAEVLSIEWDMGDGKICATSLVVIRQYEEEGNYTITLRILNDNDEEIVITKVVNLVHTNTTNDDDTWDDDPYEPPKIPSYPIEMIFTISTICIIILKKKINIIKRDK